jgi:hypothetical protein
LLVPALILAATSVASAGSFATIYSFRDLPLGAAPWGDISVGPDGTLYGSTFSGGRGGYGTCFALLPPKSAGGAWQPHLLHSFTNGRTSMRNAVLPPARSV